MFNNDFITINIRRLIKIILVVTKKLVVNLLSWLLSMFGYEVYRKENIPIKQDKIQTEDKMTQQQLDQLNSILKRFNNDIATLKNEVQTLRKNEEFYKQNSFELGDKLNILEAQLKELQKELKSESSDNKKHLEETSEPNPVIALNSEKMYFEPSSDGKLLVNVSTTGNISSNFIELDTSSGVFSILQSPRHIEYILANKDYSLAACEVHIASNAPTSITVEEPGLAQKNGYSDDWSVIKKAKITLL